MRGSNFNDVLTGDGGDNILIGGGGADKLDGRAGIDAASYGRAQAGVTASLAKPSLNTGEAAGDTYSAIENLVGSNFNDVLSGNGANNVLYGGIGADKIGGGAGIDTASYGGAQAGVTASLATPSLNTGEAAGDTYSSIEGLWGSHLNDVLTGNASANNLSGLSGDDFLDGGLGNDTLDGGMGRDTFAFSTALAAGNFDTVFFFEVSNDKIALSRSIFTKAGAVGALSAGAFQLGNAAKDAGDRIIYNQPTGSLWYDADGTGAKAAVQFASVVTVGIPLSADNFTII